MSSKTVFKSAAAVIFALLLIVMAGCQFPDAYSVRVTSIEGVPETGEVDVPLVLNATVKPDFASNKEINWSVKDAGSTGTNISGNILTARAIGIVIISARIRDGISDGRDFIRDFEITISRDGIRPITKVTLTVPGPAKGRVPDTNPASVKPSAEDNGKYTISEVTWSPNDVPFKGNTEYTVTVTLRADTSRYMFADPVAAKINNNIADVIHNDGATITLSHKFVATLDKEITDITVKTQPVKLTYTENEELDLSGLVVTLTFDIGPPEDVPFDKFLSYSSITVQPEDGETLSIFDHDGKPVVISAGGFDAETKPLTVNVAVARIGVNGWYSSLTDAINAAANGTAKDPTEIVILKDITVDSSCIIPAGKNIRLNVEEGKKNIITAAPGDFALFNVANTDSSLTLGPTTGNGTLTLTGNNQPASADRRGVYVKGGTLNMNSGVIITGFNNDRGDVFVANNGSSGRISLSGTAQLDTLTLSADANGNAVADIASGWNAAYITKLNLQGSGYSIPSVIDMWKGKTVLEGTWLNADNIENMNFKIWNFIDVNGQTQRMNTKNPPDAPYGYAIGDSGQYMGKLIVAEFNIYLEAQRYIEAKENITITVPHDYVMPRPLTIPNPGTAGITLTIKGSNTATTMITHGAQDTNPDNGLFIVNSGIKLEFEGIVVDGDKTILSGNAITLVRVNAGGTFTMNAGAVLRNNRAANGGGVYNYGGTFIMNSGSKITNNTATSSGGGVYAGTVGSTFTMNGGEISGNTATSSGGGVYFSSSSGKFTMNDGEISGNSGAGVYFSGSNSTFTMSGGEIKNNTGSSGYGVYFSGSSSTFTMSDSSTISGNSGYGVYVYSGTFNMNGGGISGNSGNGVYVYAYNSSVTFTMSGGEIKNNTASGNGGGVYVYGSSYSGTFTMRGGTISGNTASNGGGVYVNSNGTFNMYGGAISGNTAAGNGGGVYNNATFRVGGTAKVSANTTSNAYITASTYITLGTGDNAPKAGMEIWAQTKRNDYVLVPSGATSEMEANFKSDEGGEFIVLSGMVIIADPSISKDTWDFYREVEKYGTAKVDMTITVKMDLPLPIPVIIPTPETTGIKLTIEGNTPGRMLIRGTEDATAGNGLFSVQNGAQLIFEDIIVDGDQSKHTKNTASLVRVNAGGTFTMNNGAVLQNNRAESGSAVYVVGSSSTVSGTFIMNSGSKITNNTATTNGGGVYAGNYVTFTMNGGEISGNSGAGVYFSGSNSTFTMSGGEIKNNTGSSGYGVYFSSSGGTFTMSGSSAISGNSGYGVYAYGGTFTMSGGGISGNSGSGVYVYAYNSSVTFTMSGGEIKNNTASGNGGGVYVYGSSYSGTFTMSGGTISSNTASGSGGGVYVYSGTFTMSGGTISSNTANGTGTNGGGGVYVSSGYTFTMSGGEISGNTAAAGNGGGVYNNGTFNMYDSTISGNRAAGNGGGVYNNGAFRVGGAAKVYDNTKADGATRSNVYLPNKYITLGTGDNAPKAGMEIWAQTTRGDCIVVANGATLAIEDYFKADEDGKEVSVQEGRLLIGNATEFPPPLTDEEKDFYQQVEEYGTATADKTITVEKDLTLPKIVNVPAPGKPGITLTIKGNPATTRLIRGTEDAIAENGLFIVPNGAWLVFENIIVDGDQSKHTDNNASLVHVNAGGTFTMNAGAVLQNNRATSGGGVYNSGTFNMSGGEIKNNTATSYGGGVYVNSGSFTMSASTISGNKASNGGGVYVLGTSTIRGTFTMNSGSKITNNTATSGGGVYTSSYVAITMNDGEISGNSGAGVYFYSSSGTFDMKGGEIKNNTTSSGYGVYVNSGTFRMDGGAISGNSGSGVYVYAYNSSVTFTMSGGEISGNTASSGGGVYVTGSSSYSGTFTMSGGEIKNNTASGSGGGVYVSNYGTFTMNSGTISGNKANGTGASNGGGGVYNSNTFNMYGGAISGNTAATNGGGVYNNAAFTAGGAAKVSGNTRTDNTTRSNAYITGDRYITLSTETNPPAAGMEIWVQTTRTDSVVVTTGSTVAMEAYFKADEAGKSVVFNINVLMIK